MKPRGLPRPEFLWFMAKKRSQKLKALYYEEHQRLVCAPSAGCLYIVVVIHAPIVPSHITLTQQSRR